MNLNQLVKDQDLTNIIQFVKQTNEQMWATRNDGYSVMFNGFSFVVLNLVKKTFAVRLQTPQEVLDWIEKNVPNETRF